ncbi:RimJ/RimL family protein N-acetyltransferase [Mycetocola sp. BIGb0189]|uniref:GNAT family N-acetyltransferase n=1 Tax=Mycetocola sp. BIGb0189 TaxID=2940604 RepID=UPI0021680076|nr:GNAT family protein [Mycetocola sp. BIGb0189]MCS4276986.1 RimJ/RimL family protein N-acetyltransferase [Mycetocola sp. BIGb0189]
MHVVQRPSIEVARERWDSGDFALPNNLAYWITRAGERIGYLNFQEISDGTPMLDLRLADHGRGLGFGTRALDIGLGLMFTLFPAVNRIEGNTRIDNTPMRRVFEHVGFVKEAHYRQGWAVEGSEPVDSVAYALLRGDWETGTTTPVVWES